MAANLEIGGAVKRTQKGDADWYYGGDNEAWASLAAAKAGVPAAVRPGKTVGVFVSGSVVEYWWPTSAVSDADLVIKVPPVVTDAAPVNGSSNPVQSGGVYTALNNKQDNLGYTAENTANKNVANGYAGLDGSGKVPSTILPSYVDDVLEFANFAALPGTGETGKIYVTLDTNFEYRWSGSAYIRLVSSPGSTDALAEGVTNLYYTAARVKAYADTLYASLTGSYADPAWINSLAASKLTGDALPANVIHSILTTLGTIITGVWNATVIDPQYGGTGLASYTIGDLLYASGPSTLSKLLAVATGNVLLSGGAGSAPTYGKVGLTTHVTGILPTTNGGSGTSSTFTPGSLIFASPSGVYTQDNANLFYDATNHRIALANSAPTHTLTLGSASTGLAYYNTADQTTNYERIRMYWTSNQFNIGYEGSGTAPTNRGITISAASSTITLGGSSGTSNTITFNATSNSFITNGVYQFLGGATLNSSSLTQAYLSIFPGINQTGTAGFRGLYLSAYITSQGSNSNQFLLDLGTNTAANGTGTHSSVFTVDKLGNGYFGGNVGIGTNATHPITLGAGSTGSVYYNTTDQITNYERFRTYWNNNIFTLTTEKSGTGLDRGFSLFGGVTSTIGVNGRTLTITGVGINQTGGFAFNSLTSANNASNVASVAAFTANSGVNNGVAILDSYNHSSTAGYRALWISPYEASIGSGNKYLIDAGLNTAALGAGTHTSVFTVDRVGNTVISGTSTITGGILNSSSLLQPFVSVFPTINQTGTAGFKALFLSAYITSQGSGNSQSLIDIGTNTAANGAGTHNSKFSVNNSGDTLIGGQLAIPGGSIITASPFTAGNFYASGFNAATQSLTQTTWLFGGAVSVQVRVNLGGTTMPTLTANNNYTNALIANTGYNTASTGTHAFANSLTVLPVNLGTNNGASVTNTASLYIDNAGTGATNNYALYSALGANYFGGKVLLGTPSSTAYLNIGGTVTPSSQIARLINASGTVQATANNDVLFGLDLTNINFSASGGTSFGNSTISNSGSGYTNGQYFNVSATGGSGTGLVVNVFITGGVVTQVNATSTSLPNCGVGYVIGDVLTVSSSQLGGTGSGFTFTVTQVIYSGVSSTQLKVNTLIPSSANTGNIGSSVFPYSNISANTLSINTLANLTGSTFKIVTSSVNNASFYSSGNTLISAGTQTDPGYRLGVNGNILGNGTIVGSSGVARGMYLNHALQPNANSDTLVGIDINNATNFGATAIATLGSITAGSGYTNGNYGNYTLTGGTGNGATASIVVAGGIVTSVTIVTRGTGYTVADVLSCPSLPLGSGFSIPVATIGLSGVSYLSLRTSGAAQVGGNLSLPVAGSKINIATGTNASIGTSTLVAGTITINTTAVSASSIIMICRKANGGTVGGLTYGTIVAGTSFVISSDSSTDTSQVNWWILN